jgi:glucose/mannose-6-phosphate isomerase
MKSSLTSSKVKTLDPDDMLGKTLELGRQIEQGIALGRDWAATTDLDLPSQLDWFGLGGSAIVGDLVDGFGVSPIPLHIWRQPKITPEYPMVSRVVYSYSGNTIESLCAFDEGVAFKEMWLSVSSGGELEVTAKNLGIPHLKLPEGYPPRAAVGFGIGAFMALFSELSHESLPWSNRDTKVLLEDSKKYQSLNPAENPALHLAEILSNKTPILYAADPTLGPSLVKRACAQFAENSKRWSHAAVLPELVHNEVESFPALARLTPPPYVLFVGTWPFGDFPDPCHPVKMLMDELKIEWRHVGVAGKSASPNSRIVDGLRTMLFLDAVSVFLGLLSGENPMEIPTISKLKRLRKKA